MKGNTFRKTVSALASVAMVAQLGFIIPVSAEELSVEILNADYVVTVNDEGNTLTIPVTNNSDAEGTVTAYIATYSGDTLKSIELDTAAIAASGSDTLSLAYAEPGAGESVRLFVWGNNNVPIIKTLTVAEGEASAETTAPAEEETTEPSTEAPTEPVEETTEPSTEAPTEEVSEDVYYSQDYESVTDITSVWKAGSFTEGLKLNTDNTKYVHFDNNGQSGGRTANSDFSVDLSNKTEYVVEFDLAITSPYNYSGTSQFAIRTGAAPSGNNYVSVDDSLFYIEFETGTNEAVINGVSAAKYTFPSGVWCHYKVYADAEKDLATITITNSTDSTVLADKIVVPINDGIESITGAIFGIGRGNGVMNLDNIVVRSVTDEDEFGETGEETLSEITLDPGINTRIYQPELDAPVHMPLAVKATGIYGGDLTDKVTITWTTTGIKEEDGYISLTKEEGTGMGTDGDSPDGSPTAYFNVRNGVSNWFGNITVTVSYLDETLTASTPFAVIGASSAGTNLAPQTGYYEDMSYYADDLVGYKATANSETGQDLVLNNWSIYGSNGARSLELKQDDDSTKYLQFNSNGGGGSTVGVYQLADQAEQYIVDMKVRFTGGSMSFGHYLRTPNNRDPNASWSASYSGGTLTMGNQSITGLNSTDWFRVVVSADESSGIGWMKVYDNEGGLVGAIDNEPLLGTASDIQKYFCFNGTYPVDLAKFKIYYPTASTLNISGGDGVLQVPEATAEGNATTTEELTAVMTDVDGYTMTGVIDWSLADEYTGVEIKSTGAQTAELTIGETAAAGDITIVASNGSTRVEKTVTLSTSGNSIAFTSSTTSMTIPFEGEPAVTASFAAEARNKDGEPIETNNGVTLSMVNAQGETYTNDNITFADGTLTVSAGAPSVTLYIKADAVVGSDGETENLSSRVRVNIHGLSFSFGTEDPEDESFTKVTSADAYSDRVGYGFADTSVITDAGTNVSGTAAYRFKAKVPNGNYVVKVETTSSSIKSEVVENVTATTGITKTGTQFTVAVCDEVLDLTFDAGTTLTSIAISQDAPKAEREKPMLYAIGDSTTNSTSPGFSWGNCVPGVVAVPDSLMGFENHGKAGDDSVVYYNAGRVENVLLSICPGDYVTVNMGINSKEAGEPASYYTLLDEYYVQGIIQRGGIPIIVTATPQGPVNKGIGNYDEETGIFTCNRGTDAHNGDLRKIAQKYDLNIIELGYWGDDYFNGLTQEDATESGFDSVIDMVRSWYPDHNHYTQEFGKVIAEYILDCVSKIESGSTDFNQAKDPHINEQ